MLRNPPCCVRCDTSRSGQYLIAARETVASIDHVYDARINSESNSQTPPTFSVTSFYERKSMTKEKRVDGNPKVFKSRMRKAIQSRH
jgi:hypothetical protein